MYTVQHVIKIISSLLIHKMYMQRKTMTSMTTFKQINILCNL